MATAIKDMHVRGAGLIGAAAGYGMFLAAKEALSVAESRSAVDRLQAFEHFVQSAAIELLSTRPTAVNLEHAVKRLQRAMEGDYIFLVERKVRSTISERQLIWSSGWRKSCRKDFRGQENGHFDC